MRAIAPGTWLIDLLFRGHPRYIACYVLDTGTGVALVDPGPASTLPTLEAGLHEAGLGFADIEALLLTHIHLDHAGATGSIVKRNAEVAVHVHARGARHMIDPSKLLTSATRLYGDRMDDLWGEFLATPADNVRELHGGETLRLGGRDLAVAYTPGHAIHHVAYVEADSRIAWVGDVAGIRIDGGPFVLPVTPPPDIDLEAWRDSFARLRELAPATLCPTHFGPAGPAEEHLLEHEARLQRWADRVADDLRSGIDEAAAAEAFAVDARREIEATIGPQSSGYLTGGGMHDSWHGLARYWRKRGLTT